MWGIGRNLDMGRSDKIGALMPKLLIIGRKRLERNIFVNRQWLSEFFKIFRGNTEPPSHHKPRAKAKAPRLPLHSGRMRRVANTVIS